MSAKQAYKTKIQISFIGSKYIEMNPNKIKYIIIEHMYESKAMPVIYLSMSVEVDLYNIIVNEKDFAKIFLRIQKYNTYSGTSLSKDYIKNQFTYFVPSSTPEYSNNIVNSNPNVDSSYRTLTIGLMDMDIMNTLRKTFGGFEKDIDLYSLIYKAIEDTKIVLKTPIYNTKYDELFVPTMTSRKQMLDFIFSKQPFYNTEFMYFIDFNTSYLLDKTGEAVDANDGLLNDIIIDVRPVTVEEAYNEGMEEKNGSYYLFLNPTNIKPHVDVYSEKVSNQLIAVGGDKTVTMDLNINRYKGSSTKQVFRRMGESGAVIYKNAIESTQICLELIKENIDSKFITPNKTFNIHYDGHSEYNGRYTLLYKKEIIQGGADNFTSVVTIGVRKVNDIQQIGSSTINNQSNTSITSTTAAGSNYTTLSKSNKEYSKKVFTTSSSR